MVVGERLEASLGGAALSNGAANVAGGPFTIISGTPFNLPGFGATNVVVRFTPASAGGFANNAIFTTGNAGNATNSLSGTALSTAVANFTGNPLAGLAPLTVTFTNASTGSISNYLWDFGDGTTTNSPAATLMHTYLAASTNSVSLTVSNPLGTNTLPRAGYVIVTNPPPQLALSPTNLNFGSLVIGQSSTQAFQVVNSGGLILTGNVTTVPPFAVQSGSPFTVASSQTGQVFISFSPTNAASFSNAAVFVGNAGNRTNSLAGIGLTPAQIAVSPATLPFGLLAVGSNAQASFVVTNQGGAALSNGVATLTAGPFSILSGTPFNLPGFSATNLVVRFTPTNTGSFTNNAVFTTDNAGDVTNLLTGSAAIPPAANFSALPTAGEWPLTVLFSDLSTGTITNSFWDFGDGGQTNTTSTSLAYSYPGMGTNSVSLTVSGPLGASTLIRTNFIVITNVPPVTLSILLQSNQVQLIWREGILQSCAGPNDTFTNVSSATSPYNLLPSESTRFFRVKVR
jgi:PKD repeat protein